MTNTPQDAVERVRRELEKWNGRPDAKYRTVRVMVGDLRTILSLLKPDEEMERIRELANELDNRGQWWAGSRLRKIMHRLQVKAITLAPYEER